MKTKTIYVRKAGKITEVTVQIFTCPFCGTSYLADQEELDKFETYTCPLCLDDIYFEDAEKGDSK